MIKRHCEGGFCRLSTEPRISPPLHSHQILGDIALVTRDTCPHAGDIVTMFRKELQAKGVLRSTDRAGDQRARFETEPEKHGLWT
jgi:hypothetical protein